MAAMPAGGCRPSAATATPPGAQTACPGQHLYAQLPDVRERVARPLEEDPMSALNDNEQHELFRLARQIHAETADRETGRLREVAILTRAIAGEDPLEPSDIAAGGEARPLLKTLFQGALLDGIREPSPDHPDRGVLREPFVELLREALTPVDPTG